MKIWVLWVSDSFKPLPLSAFERKPDAKKALQTLVDNGLREGNRVQLHTDGVTGSVNQLNYEIVGVNLVKADPFDEVEA